jgi:hypothetical protein
LLAVIAVTATHLTLQCKSPQLCCCSHCFAAFSSSSCVFTAGDITFRKRPGKAPSGLHLLHHLTLCMQSQNANAQHQRVSVDSSNAIAARMSSAHIALKVYLIVVEFAAFSIDALLAALAQYVCLDHARKQVCLAASADLVSAKAKYWSCCAGCDLTCLLFQINKACLRMFTYMFCAVESLSIVTRTKYGPFQATCCNAVWLAQKYYTVSLNGMSCAVARNLWCVCAVSQRAVSELNNSKIK